MKRVLTIAALALIVAGCAKTKEETTLVGKFGDNDPGSVQIAVKTLGIDTTVNVVDAAFRCILPVDKCAFGVAKAGDFRSVQFVLDGSEITIDFTTGEVSSSDPNGVQSALLAFNNTLEAIQGTYEKSAEEVNANTEFSEEEKAENIEELEENAIDEMIAAAEDAVIANPDNAVAIMAVRSFGPYMEPEDAEECIAKMSDNVKATEQMQNFIKSVSAAKATAEGNPFVDFEVDGVKFSDFIGKGKYVLVDFWASWCGPCRGEIPNIKAVYEKYKGKDFDVLGVAAWDKPEDTRKAIEEEGIKWNQIINSQKIATDAYGINGIPMIILFGPDGTILKKNLRGEDIEKAVKEALGR